MSLVGVLSVTILSVAFGAGYKATKSLTNDQSAWLSKGVTIAQVNGPAAREDAVVADQPVALAHAVSDQLEVVQEPDGAVYTADPVTRQVFRIDLTTMTPGPATAGQAVLAAGFIPSSWRPLTTRSW